VAHLKLLAGYFQKLEREARGYLKDPRQLEEALAALEGRRLSAEHAVAALASRRPKVTFAARPTALRVHGHPRHASSMKILNLLALCVLISACGSATIGGNPQSTPTPSEAASPSAAPSPSASVSPTTSPVVSPAPTPVCATIRGGTSSRATITDVRVGTHPGYDRVVVEFSGGLPEYRLVPQDPSTFVGPFSGLPMHVAGRAGYHLYISNMDVPPAYQHGNIVAMYPELKQVMVMAVFEGQADIAIGLDHAVCPVVSTLSSPSRLVIDFPS
jgi:hypothetical protein